MRLATLRRRTLRQARRENRRGNLTDQDLRTVVAVCNDEASLAELNARVERDVNPWNNAERLYGADWRGIFKNIWDWFVENWSAILKIILTIAPLLILDDGEEN